MARDYFGYYGTWSITGNSVIHHIEGAMIPNRIGRDAERPFAVSGDVLELKILPVSTVSLDSTLTCSNTG